MLVDKEKIRTKIYSLKTSLARLQELKRLEPKEFLTKFANFDSAKYNLIVAVEAEINPYIFIMR
jgi:uncharacterized protein YutE (UPF0331/DUF86 family)